MSLWEGFRGALNIALQILGTYWWIILPVVLAVLLWQSWLYYIRTKFIAAIKWTLLQITVPQDVLKTPLAMEQIFAGLHSTLFPGGRYLRYVMGRVQEWFSFEMVSNAGVISFYVRTPKQFKNHVESHVYAQYPNAEIQEVEDYVWNVSADVPNDEYDLFGSEFILAKEDAYPIRTWMQFKFEAREGEEIIDPLAGLLEAMSTLGAGEQLWLQIGIKPVGDDWKKEGEKIVSKILKRPEEPKKGSHVLEVLKKEATDYISGMAQAPFRIPEYGVEEKKDKKEAQPSIMQYLSPGEREVVESIELNIAKVGFETVVRIIYVARRDVYNPGKFFSVTSALRQFSTQNLNALRVDRPTLTTTEWPIPWPRFIVEGSNNFRKKWLLFKYRFRYKPHKPFVFNIEELATVFHFPGRIVTTPALPRIPIKKGEPPPSLPIL